jgi:hypothetical protein
MESKQGPLGTSATHWPIVPAPSDCEDGEFGGMNGRRNRSTRKKPAPAPLCPPQIPLDQTRATAMGSQRLTASAMARPGFESQSEHDIFLHSRCIEPFFFQIQGLQGASSWCDRSISVSSVSLRLSGWRNLSKVKDNSYKASNFFSDYH